MPSSLRSSVPQISSLANGEWDDVAQAVQRPNLLRILFVLFISVLAVQLVMFLVSNPRFEWPVVARYFFDPSVLKGLGTTLFLTLVAMVIGMMLGTVMAVALLSDFRPVRSIAQLYLWAFRGTPLLIQLIFWYNLAYLTPTLSIGLPFMPAFIERATNEVITPLAAAILGLGLAEGAYMTEIVRAGISSVDARQRDAARALGMPPLRAFFRIIFPQAMRFIIPPTGNQVIGMAKATALVSVIAMNDLLHSVQMIYNRTYEIVPLLIVASLWYLVVITLMYFVQARLERHFGKGQSRDSVQDTETAAVQSM